MEMITVQSNFLTLEIVQNVNEKIVHKKCFLKEFIQWSSIVIRHPLR